MAKLAEIQKLNANFSKDIIAKIDTVHSQITDVNSHLNTFEMRCLDKDMVDELERGKQLLSIKLDDTRDAMEKASCDFIKV